MITAALIGNPNSGKTTVFNKLTGAVQRVGNWPGVTIDRKQGYIRNTSKDKILVVDLPGIYSLSPYSPEEIVSRDYLIGTAEDRPDVAINIVDASNIERGLYLLQQVSDLSIPMVVVLNMVDVAEKNDMKVDAKKLSEALGCEVVETVGISNQGMDGIADAVQRAYEEKNVPKKTHYSAEIEKCIADVNEIIGSSVRDGLERWCSIKMLERDQMVMDDLDKDVCDKAMNVVTDFEKSQDDDGTEIIASARYDLADEIVKNCVTFAKKKEEVRQASPSVSYGLGAMAFIGCLIMVVATYMSWAVGGGVSYDGVDLLNGGFDGEGWRRAIPGFGAIVAMVLFVLTIGCLSKKDKGRSHYAPALFVISLIYLIVATMFMNWGWFGGSNSIGDGYFVSLIGAIMVFAFSLYMMAFGNGKVSDAIDSVLLHRVLAIPIFIVVMYLVYFVSIQTIGTMGTDFINDNVTSWVQDNVRDGLNSFMDVPDGEDNALVGLIVDGIIAGVFAVLGFLPQIIVLFLCLSLLEECGYMARVAYLLDRIFCHFGLSGKTVIPAVIGIGCGVPAIMGSRTIEDDQTRRITAMTVTFMPCSAKLPVITVIVAAFFHESAAVALSMYLLGIVMILLSGIILKKFKGVTGNPSPFIMELPVYHTPTVRNVLTSTGERSWSFVRKAGTFILLSAVIIWLLSSYDTGLNYIGNNSTDGSILADFGKAVTGVFALQGFGDFWELTVASITGLMAKENLLGTMAVLFGDVGDEDGFITSDFLAATGISSGQGMAFLIFNLLCAPCFAAIGAMHRELGTWKATGIAVLYQCVLAWCVSLIYYQFWLLVTGDVDAVGLIVAIVVVVIIGYFLLAKDPVGAIKKNAAKMGNKGGASE